MKTNNRKFYEIEYTYWGCDEELHQEISTVRGKNQKDAIKTLAAIINRDEGKKGCALRPFEDAYRLFFVESIALA